MTCGERFALPWRTDQGDDGEWSIVNRFSDTVAREIEPWPKRGATASRESADFIVAAVNRLADEPWPLKEETHDP